MGVFSFTLSGTVPSGSVDFFEITAPSTGVVEILSCHIGQSSEAGDAEAEMLSFVIKRGIGSTSGSGGTVAVGQKMQTGGAAAKATGEVLNTTKMTGGTIETLYEDAFHVAAGLHYVPVPEERIFLSPSELLTVELTKNVADSIDFHGTLMIREIGG